MKFALIALLSLGMVYADTHGAGTAEATAEDTVVVEVPVADFCTDNANAIALCLAVEGEEIPDFCADNAEAIAECVALEADADDADDADAEEADADDAGEADADQGDAEAETATDAV